LLTVLAAVAFAVATSPSASAQTATVYPWWVLPSGPCSSDFSCTTIEQSRATASGGVGFCYQNRAFTVASGTKALQPKIQLQKSPPASSIKGTSEQSVNAAD
jgi:hypothetical protein